ncbi:calcium-binding protein [Pseudophaeobacter sp.]|jgi:hypothetical protein|uniref:beta strand repeat-containing protein n=1 Tax=Pseudophaeobacter sp. TaxID=1971739 RepID=UPI0032D984A8
MATVTFDFTDGVTLTGTSGDDQVTLTGTGTPIADEEVTIVGGAGNDTVVFDGTLGGTFEATAGGFYNDIANPGFAAADDEAYFTNGIESFTFDNGTVTSNAAVTTELLLDDALSQEAKNGASWDVTQLTTYNGSEVDTDATWSLQTVDGQSLTGNNTVTLLDGTTVLGTLSLNADDVQFAVDNAFLSSLDIGETADVSFDIVLTDGTDTFTETVTAVVEGVASDADNIFVASATATTTDLMGGDDQATGGAGDDTIHGGEGDDTMYAGGSDTGADDLFGNDGDDLLAGGAGADDLVGDSIDSNTLTSDAATVATDEGANTIYGGAGADNIAIGGFNAAGIDFDAVGLAVSLAATQAGATGSVGGEAYGGADNDFIIGTDSGDDLVGMGNGNDTVVLGSGDNTVYAGADDTGTDTVFVEAASTGANEIYTGAGVDTITTGAGNDTVGSGDDGDIINLSAGGNNVVYAGAGDDNITGGAGNDVIYGGAGGDTINLAAGGNNTAYAGSGDNILTAGAGNDTFVFVTDGDSSIAAFGTAGTDVIDLTSFDIAFGDIVTSTDGVNMDIYIDADTSITLTGVTSVDAGDFLF